jgi:hypothetical protein
LATLAATPAALAAMTASRRVIPSFFGMEGFDSSVLSEPDWSLDGKIA